MTTAEIERRALLTRVGGVRAQLRTLHGMVIEARCGKKASGLVLEMIRLAGAVEVMVKARVEEKEDEVMR